MNADTESHVENRLLKLWMNGGVSPEQALQYLSSPCMVPWSYRKGDSVHFTIFLAYLKYIMARQPGGHLVGIWEEIFRKIVVYSRYFNDDFENEIRRMRRTYVLDMFNKVIPVDNGPTVDTWLGKALCTLSKCPNPYIRLELFRMMRIFHKQYENRIWDQLSNTLIHTISEIQPHFLKPNGDVDDHVDDVLFGLNDLNYILSKCFRYGNLYSIIKPNIFNLINAYNKEVVNSKETRFISICIQLTGEFAIMASSITDRGSHIIKLRKCLRVFRIIRHLVDFEYLSTSRPDWNQIQYVLSQPVFHCYVVEAVRDLTAAIINNITGRDIGRSMPLIRARDDLTRDLDACTMICDFPRLLLCRQVQGSKLAHHNFLLLPKLYQFTKEKDCNGENIVDEWDANENNDNESSWRDIGLEDSDTEIFMDEIARDLYSQN
ncbi:unnamed protein product [Meganyctiphanes norvegica]|uniref:Uncharacterized protein n=1 Tax=Meganyctiphanes norvegica TaxID=48144 RepID=A0AAV2S6G7_MEGNR